jgi:pimeloyl-ACP methyl ester carboxylesterase
LEEKRENQLVQVSVRETNESEPFEDASLRNPELLAGSPWQKAYAGIAPDPTNWSALVFKVRDLDVHFVGWKSAEVQAIQAPALLIIGDSDIVRPEHVVEMFRLLGGGVPGDVNL